jgi:hypothetical protein
VFLKLSSEFLTIVFSANFARVGKNPGLKIKKNQPGSFFWGFIVYFLGFIVYFLGFIGFLNFVSVT